MKRASTVILLASGWLAASAAVGCGPPPIGPPPGPPPGVRGEPIRRKAATPLVSMPIHRPAEFDRTALPEVVKANNALVLDLYRAMRSGSGNTLVSPACLTAGLAMLRAGARGETAAEIDRALHRSGPLADGAIAALIRDLNADGLDSSFQVRLADAVWFQEGYPIVGAYRRTLQDVFALDDEPRVDFNGHPDRAATLINEWVAARTGGKIANVLSPDTLMAPTKMVVTSALYLRADWVQSFHEAATDDAPFHVSPSETVTVPMMHLHSYMKIHGYADLGSYRVVSLPCGRGTFTMLVFLPGRVDGLGDLEVLLTPAAIDAAWSALKAPGEIDISLPRFRLRTSLRLNPVLEALGVSRAFDRRRADFSGINGEEKDLAVVAAMHGTYIDVNESGIEATAATEIISRDSFEDKSPVIVVDHPFFYAIRDNRSGCLLFLGRVVNPSSATH